jgi:hypothetical protein
MPVAQDPFIQDETHRRSILPERCRQGFGEVPAVAKKVLSIVLALAIGLVFNSPTAPIV